MRQKLALVLALLSNPPVLLLDEPTSNLDVGTREEFGRLLARLKANGKTLLFCTHRAGEILSLADRVVVLRSGKKAEEGSPEELRHRLLKPAVLRLTVLAGRREEAVGLLRAAGFRVLAVRPVGLTPDARLPAAWWLPAARAYGYLLAGERRLE